MNRSSPRPPCRVSTLLPPCRVSLLLVPVASMLTVRALASRLSPAAAVFTLRVTPSVKAVSAWVPSVTVCRPVPVRSSTSKPCTLSKLPSTSTTAPLPPAIRRVSSPAPPTTVTAASRFTALVNSTVSSSAPPSITSAPPKPSIRSLPAPPLSVSARRLPRMSSTPSPPCTENPAVPPARVRSIVDPAAAALRLALPALLVPAVATKSLTLLAVALAPADTCSSSPVLRSFTVRLPPSARKLSLPAPPVKVVVPLLLRRMSP